MAAKKQAKAAPLATIPRRPGRPRYAETTGRTVEGGRAPKRYYRMTDEDYAVVQSRAQAAGVTVAEFTRRLLLSGELPVR